jgi:hypothetical protein
MKLIIEPKQPLFGGIENGEKNRRFERARRMKPAIGFMLKMPAALVIVHGHSDCFEAKLTLDLADPGAQSFRL